MYGVLIPIYTSVKLLDDEKITSNPNNNIEYIKDIKELTLQNGYRYDNSITESKLMDSDQAIQALGLGNRLTTECEQATVVMKQGTQIYLN